MTEIPEHLLKRSKSAKSSKSDEPEAVESAAPAKASSAGPAATPAAVAQTTSGPLIPTEDLPNLDPPVPPKPETPEFVKAANRRKKIPMWAMPVLAVLPIWAYGYAGTVQTREVEDPLFVEGALFYSDLACASCHGATGGGGIGYPLDNGSVLETFPEPIDQIAHVARGSAAIGGEAYGAERAGGARVAGALGTMPAHEDISMVELEMVVFHERAVLNEEDTSSAEYQEWMEHMRESYESGDTDQVDLELILQCANSEFTPGGGDVEFSEETPCPGPHSEGAE